MKSLNNTISKLLEGLDQRQRDVLVKRYGLDGEKSLTLQEIGDKYGITRERVRQIENLALMAVHKKIKKGLGEDLLKEIDIYLKENGGVKKEDSLVQDFKNLYGDKINLASLNFLREASGRFNRYKEDGQFYSFWYSDKKNLQNAKSLINKFYSSIKNKKEDLISGGKFGVYLAKAIKPFKVKEPTAVNYLEISKKFKVNPYGDFGLTEWSEINPWTIRDWTYLVLKKAGKPLHFREIASAISSKNKKRKIFAPTVHNELIKDPRFVLVGRGLYGLIDFGYQAGNLKDLIKDALAKNGPMKSVDIVKVVSSQRYFKKNTILLHLQNRKIFKRSKEGFYELEEA